MLWLKTFYEAVGLPKLNGVAINGNFCEPPRLLLIRAADINPIDNVAVRPDHIGAVPAVLWASGAINVKDPSTLVLQDRFRPLAICHVGSAPVHSVDGQLHQHQHERPDIWSRPCPLRRGVEIRHPFFDLTK